MELEQIKRKIEGEAERTLKMDEARGTFEEDMETLKSMLPFSFSSLLSLSLSLSLSPTDTLPEVEIEQERRSRTEVELICKRLDAGKTTSTSGSTLSSSLARQLRRPRRPSTKLAETLDNEVKQKEYV